MKTPLVPNDLLSLVTVTDPVITPDGDAVFFRLMRQDRETDSIVGSLWRAEPTRTAVPFTAGRNDRSPRVSPDGRSLAFIGERDGETRVYIMPTTGGEARAVDAAYPTIAAPAWSPDGERIAFVAGAEHEAQTARIFHDVPSGARHIRALPFKSDADGLLDGTRRHLFVFNVRRETCERLTYGDFDVASPAWSPDGMSIAFSAAIGRLEDALGSDIHIIDCATRAIRTITGQNGPMVSPAWSHDGATIAFIGHEHGDDAGGRYNAELFLVDVDVQNGGVHSLSAHLDRTVGNAIISDMRSGSATSAPVWGADDREIYVQLSAQGACGIQAFLRDGSGSREIAGGARDVFGFSYAAGAFALAFSTPLLPGEIAIVAADGSETIVTACNAAFLDAKQIVAPQRYRPVADDGTTLDAWLLVPPGALLQVPLVLQVHGGPHVAYGFSFFFEFQMLAGSGVAVAYGNPRGGQTYGHAYADAITGDWGGVDAADVERILDGALGLVGVDEHRIGIAGGSYGGFMTTWLLGHSDRFAAGVSMRAVNDFVSEVGASDLGWFLESELAAPPKLGDGGQQLFARSPMRAAPISMFRCLSNIANVIIAVRSIRANSSSRSYGDSGNRLSLSGSPAMATNYRAAASRAIAFCVYAQSHIGSVAICARPAIRRYRTKPVHCFDRSKVSRSRRVPALRGGSHVV